MYINI